MNLQLTDEDSEALRLKATEAGISVEDLAVRAIHEYVTDDRAQFRAAVTAIVEEDRELLDRLAQ